MAPEMLGHKLTNRDLYCVYTNFSITLIVRGGCFPLGRGFIMIFFSRDLYCGCYIGSPSSLESRAMD